MDGRPMEHTDRTALADFYSVGEQHMSENHAAKAWYVRAWSAVCRFSAESVSGPRETPRETALDVRSITVTSRLHVAELALAAAKKHKGVDENELVAMFRETAYLLGIEERVICPPRYTAEPMMIGGQVADLRISKDAGRTVDQATS